MINIGQILIDSKSQEDIQQGICDSALHYNGLKKFKITSGHISFEIRGHPFDFNLKQLWRTKILIDILR